MISLKLATRSLIRKTFHKLPINESQKFKLKNYLYNNFGFLVRNSDMYKAWLNSQEQPINIFNEDPRNGLNDDKFKELLYQCYQSSSTESKDFIKLKNDSIVLTEEDIKLIAFYLPQFHPIPENDKWWGKGFTEWTNVTKAMPQYIGHHQPQLPIDLGFYDLRLIGVMKRQIELAKKYGVYGFCFHHYWFGGKRLLEKPVDLFLEHKELDFPFCLCWANENWTRRWDGQENDILMAQKHSPEDDIAFIKDLARYINDERYIKVNGKPLIIVYRPQILPDAKATAERWRKYCRESGIGEILLIGAKTFGLQDPTKFSFDAAVEFPPHIMHSSIITDKVDVLNPNFKGIVYDFKEHVKSDMYLSKDPCVTFKTVSPGWDNTARKPNNGHIFHGSNPSLYQEWLTKVMKYTKDNHDKHNRLVFINAWNEWAEGAHLEPDRRYGYGYLQATANAILESRSAVPNNFNKVEVKNKDIVSIIAPAYNHEKYVKQSIKSVANQTFQNKELIIIDDASQDRTVEIINGLIKEPDIKEAFPEGITFIKHLNNKGAHHSINEGLKLAKGNYLAIINTDDLYEENRIEVMLDALKSNHAEFSFSKIDTINDEGNILDSVESKEFKEIQKEIASYSSIGMSLLSQNRAISTGNFFFTKKLYKLVGDFKNYKYIHDWDFVLRSILFTEPQFVSETSYLYRLHVENSFRDLREDQKLTDQEVTTVLSNIFKRLQSESVSNKTLPNPVEIESKLNNHLCQIWESVKHKDMTTY